MPPDQRLKVINSLQITVVELEHKDHDFTHGLSSQRKVGEEKVSKLIRKTVSSVP